MRQMKTKNSNTARFETLSTNLVSVLHNLAQVLDETDNEFVQRQIFASARMVQKTARLSGILSRFNAEVESDPVANVFSEHKYKYSIYHKWVSKFDVAQNCNLFHRMPQGVPFGSGCRPITKK
jgi:galactose-1-phosphate uridylyltransferase